MCPLVAGVLAVVLVAAATLTSRGLGQLAAAAPLGLAAEIAAGICGATSIAGHRGALDFVAPELAVGLGAIVAIGVVTVALVGRGAVSVMVLVVGALMGALAAVIGCIWTIPRVGEGALCVLFALVLTPFIPAIAFRLAGSSCRRCPRTPTTWPRSTPPSTTTGSPRAPRPRSATSRRWSPEA